MANFNVPSSPTTYEANLAGFLGVDFSSSITDIDKRRCPRGYNFINNNGTIEKRNGYKIAASLGEGNVNGIWNVDNREDEEFIIAHVGRKLIKLKSDFSNWEIKYSNLMDKKSQGLIFGKKLLILDGWNIIAYDINNDTVQNLEDIAYRPTTQIARSPNGLASQSYEQVNLLSSSRINLFTSTQTDTEYQLDEKNLNSVISVEVMDSNGEFQTKTLNTDYTVDLINGKVIFNTAIGLPPVDGRDNVRITFSDETDGITGHPEVNYCTIARLYGYAGANNRIFLSGNPTTPNYVIWSDIDNPTYFPANNILKLGSETVPINDMRRTNDGKLAVLKPNSDTDSTIFYVGYTTYNEEEWFPLEGSTKGEGNIGKYSNDTLINEPLILTKNGIFALNTITITDERYLYHRSYYIDSKLKQEENLENAAGISFEGKFYLAINDHVYVADSRFKSNSNNSRYSNYQLEWYYWTNLPVKTWFVWNNELYFGDKYGNICKFRKNSDENRFLDDTEPVKAEWNSVILDLSNPSHKKNIKRIAIESNPTNSKLDVGYRLKSGDKQVLSKEYVNSIYPKTTVIRKKAKKLAFFSLYIENSESTNMSFNSLSVVYTVGSFYKGD